MGGAATPTPLQPALVQNNLLSTVLVPLLLHARVPADVDGDIVSSRAAGSSPPQPQETLLRRGTPRLMRVDCDGTWKASLPAESRASRSSMAASLIMNVTMQCQDAWVLRSTTSHLGCWFMSKIVYSTVIKVSGTDSANSVIIHDLYSYSDGANAFNLRGVMGVCRGAVNALNAFIREKLGQRTGEAHEKGPPCQVAQHAK